MNTPTVVIPRNPNRLRRRLLAAGSTVLASLACSALRRISGSADSLPEPDLHAVLGLDQLNLAGRLPPAMRQELERIASEEITWCDESVPRLGDAALRRYMRERIRQDYILGRTSDVCGWRLSHTEIYCLAVAVRRG